MQATKAIPLRALFCALLAGIVIFHLGNAAMDKSLYRPIHLGTALTYADGPINLLRPVVVAYSANEAPMAQELPLWQAAVAILFKITSSKWYGWANVVSLLAFAGGLWPFFQVARQYVGYRDAWWALVFLLAQPVVVFAGGLASTDGFSLSITLWFLFFADRLVRSGRFVWWLPCALFACLAAISKLPFFMVGGLCSIALLLLNRVRDPKPWIMLAMAGMVAAAVFVLWSSYTNKLLAQAEFPFMELRFSHSPRAVFWYFGDWHYRLSPAPWIKGAWRLLHATLGGLPLVILVAVALFRPGSALAKFWLVAGFLTTFVFTQIVLVHWHYYLMVAPAVALLCGVTLARWEGFLSQELPKRWLRSGLVLLALVGSAIDGMIAMKIGIYYDYYPKEMASIIRQHTTSTDKLIVFGSDWGGEELFRAERRGFNVSRRQTLKDVGPEVGLVDLLDNPSHLARLKELGYTKVVLMSESPVRFAAVAVNPGSRRKRELYPANISPKVDAWPTVFQSEEILIKQIP